MGGNVFALVVAVPLLLIAFGEPRAARVAEPDDGDRTTRAVRALPTAGPGSLPAAAAPGGDEPDEDEQTGVGLQPRAAAPAMNGGAR